MQCRRGWILLIAAVSIATPVAVLCADRSAAEQKGVILKLRAGQQPAIPLPITKSDPAAHFAALTSLKRQATIQQKGIMAAISANRARVKQVKSFWIVNAVYVNGDEDFIRWLASWPEVEEVIENKTLLLVEPVDTSSAGTNSGKAEPGLELINARAAWRMGLTGRGTLVCNFDTGVKGDHTALASSWRGNNAATAACWFDPFGQTTYPVDNNGHGTHTMGTMVGVTEQDTVGVAFGAQWVAAAVVDRGGGISRTIADILAAFEWAADPDGDPLTVDDVPDIINNSWGVPAAYLGACDQTFWEAIDNLEALGVICLFAAGNEGPTPRSIRTPADRITTSVNAFSVGAINGQTMQIASFSSRGPSGCDTSAIKPELVAPGVGIRSCALDGGYRIMSGTSMATPHVAGAAALLRQFNPQATVDEVKTALIAGAIDMGRPGEDNDYGHGRLDILRALYHLPPPDHPFMHIISVGVEDSSDGLAQPGEIFRLRLVFDNIGSPGQMQGRLQSLLPGIQIIDSLAQLGRVGRFDTTSVTAFRIALSPSIAIGQVLPLEVELFGVGWSQKCRIDLVAAPPQVPAVADIVTDQFCMSFSNFGQFGLGPTAFNPFGGQGFRFPVNGPDCLHEATLLILANGCVSDGVRNVNNEPDNDFRPLPGSLPSVTTPGPASDHDGIAAYSDSAAESPIGLVITQRCYAWDIMRRFVDVEFTIKNISSNLIPEMYVGLFCDWDLPEIGVSREIAGYVDELSLAYLQDITSGRCFGVRTLSSPAISCRAINNETEFAAGFSDDRKMQFMTEGIVCPAQNEPSNYSHIISIGPFALPAGDSMVFAFAFVMGESLVDLRYQAQQAFIFYPGLTSVRPTTVYPASFEFSQNYPNPFNEVTTIKVSSSSPSELFIFDVAGRLVKRLPVAPASESHIVWDGTNHVGQKVASGLYFYTLGDNHHGKRKKMVLLK